MRSLLISSHLALFGLILAVCSAGCDTTGPGEPEAAVYFPAYVGKVWTYDYSYHNSDDHAGTDQRTTGILTWTVRDSTMDGTVVHLTLEEAFEGTTVTRHGGGAVVEEQPAHWTKTHTATLAGDRLRLEPFTSELPPVQWRYPLDAPDTIRVDTLLHAGFGVTNTRRLTLVRGVGLTSWAGGLSGRWADYTSYRLKSE